MTSTNFSSSIDICQPSQLLQHPHQYQQQQQQQYLQQQHQMSQQLPYFFPVASSTTTTLTSSAMQQQQQQHNYFAQQQIHQQQQQQQPSQGFSILSLNNSYLQTVSPVSPSPISPTAVVVPIHNQNQNIHLIKNVATPHTTTTAVTTANTTANNVNSSHSSPTGKNTNGKRARTVSPKAQSNSSHHINSDDSNDKIDNNGRSNRHSSSRSVRRRLSIVASSSGSEDEETTAVSSNNNNKSSTAKAFAQLSHASSDTNGAKPLSLEPTSISADIGDNECQLLITRGFVDSQNEKVIGGKRNAEPLPIQCVRIQNMNDRILSLLRNNQLHMRAKLMTIKQEQSICVQVLEERHVKFMGSSDTSSCGPQPVVSTSPSPSPSSSTAVADVKTNDNSNNNNTPSTTTAPAPATTSPTPSIDRAAGSDSSDSMSSDYSMLRMLTGGQDTNQLFIPSSIGLRQSQPQQQQEQQLRRESISLTVTSDEDQDVDILTIVESMLSPGNGGGRNIASSQQNSITDSDSHLMMNELMMDDQHVRDYLMSDEDDDDQVLSTEDLVSLSQHVDLLSSDHGSLKKEQHEGDNSKHLFEEAASLSSARSNVQHMVTFDRLVVRHATHNHGGNFYLSFELFVNEQEQPTVVAATDGGRFQTITKRGLLKRGEKLKQKVVKESCIVDIQPAAAVNTGGQLLKIICTNMAKNVDLSKVIVSFGSQYRAERVYCVHRDCIICETPMTMEGEFEVTVSVDGGRSMLESSENQKISMTFMSPDSCQQVFHHRSSLQQ